MQRIPSRHLKTAIQVGLAIFVAIQGWAEPGGDQTPFKEGFQWKVSRPLVVAQSRPGDDIHSIKDPTIVFYEGRWHLFARSGPYSIRIPLLAQCGRPATSGFTFEEIQARGPHPDDIGKLLPA